MMTDKPTHGQQIAAELRCMLYGTPHPSDDDYAQCRTMNLSYVRFAEICGYADYNDIPDELYVSVYEAGLDTLCLVIGFGAHTILIGGDFHCKPQYIKWS